MADLEQKQIHELATYSGTPATGTYFAVDNGTTTTKIDYNVLANAIIAKIGNPVTLAHGGTGATDAASALRALLAAPAVYLDTATWADINTKLTAFNAGRTATFYATGDVASMLTGTKVTSTLRGIISRTSTATFDIMASVGQGATLITVRVSDLSSSGATVGTVYRYTGTAI